MKNPPKTLVLGLGNPIFCDDAAGLLVVAELQKRSLPPGVDLVAESLAGLDLMETLVGYDRAIIVDTVKKGGEPGKIYRLDSVAFQGSRHTSFAHDVNLATALELGKRLGLALPAKIEVFAIEAADVISFSESCTALVAAAVPLCADMIFNELKGRR